MGVLSRKLRGRGCTGAGVPSTYDHTHTLSLDSRPSPAWPLQAASANIRGLGHVMGPETMPPPLTQLSKALQGGSSSWKHGPADSTCLNLHVQWGTLRHKTTFMSSKQRLLTGS